MSGQTVASVHWRALDHAGEDRCRLVQMAAGFMLVGHARYVDAGRDVALDYVVRCGADWLTESADVTGVFGGDPVALRILRGADGWQVNDRPQPGLGEARDVDLHFTPATNLMPLRRLPDVGRLEVRAAWLRDLSGTLEPLDQVYTRGRGDVVQYEAVQSEFTTQLQVGPDGFVTLYPGLWEADHVS